MTKPLKVILAVCCAIFFLALGAFGGCLAGLVADVNNGNFVFIGLIGGGIAGLWGGIILANKIMASGKPKNELPDQDPNDPFRDSKY